MASDMQFVPLATETREWEEMIIMSQGDNHGERRCTAACYNAHGDKCVCCCGGANHGKGLQGALQSQEEHFGASRVLAEFRSQLQLELV